MADIEKTPDMPVESTALPQPTPPPTAPAPSPTAAPPPSPPYGSPTGPSPGAAGPSRATGRSFWNRFFDFSFHEFITPSIIKVLFILAMVVIGLGVLSSIVVGFTSGSAAVGIFILIGALIYGFIALLFSRVFLEMIIIFFRIHDDTREIASSKKK